MFINGAALWGDASLAAQNILLKLLNSSAYFFDGFALSLEIMGGQAKGRNDRATLRYLFRLSHLWVGSVLLDLLLVLGFWGEGIFSLLTHHAEVQRLAQTYKGWLMISMAFGSFAYLLDGLFIGLNQGKLMFRSMSFALIFGMAPFFAMAIIQDNVDYLWWAMASFLLLRWLTLSWYVQRRALL